MKVADLLSDLKSLSACPPEAALKLVSVHKNPTDSASTDPDTADSSLDPDMERAATLILLHQSVKVRYQEEGPEEELSQARNDVQRVSTSLATKQ